MKAKIKLSALNKLSKTLIGKLLSQTILNSTYKQEPIKTEIYDTWIYFDLPEQFVTKLKTQVYPSELKILSSSYSEKGKG